MRMVSYYQNFGLTSILKLEDERNKIMDSIFRQLQESCCFDVTLPVWDKTDNALLFELLPGVVRGKSQLALFYRCCWRLLLRFRRRAQAS